jgi:hypothetical protein
LQLGFAGVGCCGFWEEVRLHFFFFLQQMIFSG